MSLQRITAILDLVAGISAAPELVGQDRLLQAQRSLATSARRIRGRKVVKGFFVFLFNEGSNILKEPRKVVKEARNIYRGRTQSSVILLMNLICFVALFIPPFSNLPSLWHKLLLGYPYFALVLYLQLGVLFILEFLINLILGLGLVITAKVDLSRTLLLVGFLIFLVSGVLKIASSS